MTLDMTLFEILIESNEYNDVGGCFYSLDKVVKDRMSSGTQIPSSGT